MLKPRVKQLAPEASDSLDPKRVAGTRCRGCDRVTAGWVDRCPECGSTSV